MNEEGKQFRGKYFCTPRRTKLPYNQYEAIKNKWDEIEKRRNFHQNIKDSGKEPGE